MVFKFGVQNFSFAVTIQAEKKLSTAGSLFHFEHCASAKKDFSE